MDLSKGFPPVDRPTVELLDEMFPLQSPDPDMTDREVWMMAGKRQLIDWLFLQLQYQENSDSVLR